jgi:hypothetical protein
VLGGILDEILGVKLDADKMLDGIKEEIFHGGNVAQGYYKQNNIANKCSIKTARVILHLKVK